MDVFEAILTRRSIRRYLSEKIEKKIVDKIIYAGMYAPSAANKQPWHFIIFEDESTKKAIMELHPYASMFSSAPMGILVCYDENLQHANGYGLLDCAAATQNILLEAQELGLGTCWIGVYPREERMQALETLFRLPTSIKAFCLIALGYAAETKSVPERFRPERIHKEKW